MKRNTNWFFWVLGLIITVGALIALYLDWHLFITKQIDIAGFAEILVALGTALLALVTFGLVIESRKTRLDSERIKEEERERESIRRRINDVQEWIEGALRLQSKFVNISERSYNEFSRVAALDSTIAYTKLEAHRLDVLIDSLLPIMPKGTEYVDSKLENLVERVNSLLKEQMVDLQAPQKHEIEIRKCCEVALFKLSELKANLNL
jgi:hypothetical protein